MPDSTTPTVPSPAYSREFQAKRQNGKKSNRSVKFDHLNGLGQMLSDPICWLVISAVETMNANGTRKMIDRTMATEWLAMAMSDPAAPDRGRHLPPGGRRGAGARGGDRGHRIPLVVDPPARAADEHQRAGHDDHEHDP